MPSCTPDLYPKNLRENIIFRRELINKAKNNPKLQQHLIALARKDVLYFFNVFLFTYDPRVPMVKMPFITYPFQDDVILWDKQMFTQSQDGLIEKSRDMGVTWMLVGNDLHSWLFNTEKFDVLWGSRKEIYIDSRGDMKTIFEKIRYALKNLPTWMLPQGFDFATHDNAMRLVNPQTESLIVGEATNPNFSRGGRFSRVRFDEYAFWESADSAWQAAADATRCRTALSTVNGSGNKFAMLAHSKIEKRTLHWTQHPQKNPGAYRLMDDGSQAPISVADNPNAAFEIWLECRDIVPPQGLIGGIIRSPWYDAECERRANNKEIAEELDIDYLRSGSPFFDNRAVKSQFICTEIVRENHLTPIPIGRFVRGSILESAGAHRLRDDRNGWVRVYEEPRRGGQYVVAGDVSEGLPKGDNNTLVVRDKYTRAVCAVVQGLHTPETHAMYAQKLGQWYNRALVAVENNNHGYFVNQLLLKMDCNLYWTRRKDNDGAWHKIKPGFSTTAQSRPQMLDVAREEIAKQDCDIRDEALRDEMLTFVHNEKTGKPEADGDLFKDDLVIAFAIAGQVINEFPYRAPVQEMDPEFVNQTFRKNAGLMFSNQK